MARLQHLRRAWSKMRRRYGLSGILGSAGQVCPSPTASAEALRARSAPGAAPEAPPGGSQRRSKESARSAEHL
eukprot:9467994-Pyramimonas_sp.AAC.1